MPSIGTVIGKIKCRATGKVFPLYRYIELRNGLKLYQITTEDCEEKANYIVIVFGTIASLCYGLCDMSSTAKTIVVSKELQGVALPPNFDFVSLDITDDYIPS